MIKVTMIVKDMNINTLKCKNIVVTVTLGSQLKQGLAKVRAKSEAENHISCSWECKRM
jgi:hypothetical protein